MDKTIFLIEDGKTPLKKCQDKVIEHVDQGQDKSSKETKKKTVTIEGEQVVSKKGSFKKSNKLEWYNAIKAQKVELSPTQD